jgi:hypothetical protein
MAVVDLPWPVLELPKCGMDGCFGPETSMALRKAFRRSAIFGGSLATNLAALEENRTSHCMAQYTHFLGIRQVSPPKQ